MLANRDTGCVYHIFTVALHNVPDLPPSAVLDSSVVRRRQEHATATIVALGDARDYSLIVPHITTGDYLLAGS